MKLLLHVPLPRGSTRGNWITALRWTQILTDLGHTVCTVDPSEYDAMIDSSYDALIALHARRSAEQIVRFRTTVPQGKIILALTGTDLHVDLNGDSPCFRNVTESMNVADRIVLLEPEGRKQLVADLHSKCVVIYQSSTLPSLQRPPQHADFRISLLAHLREVKDPFLLSRAVEQLPTSSRVQVMHAGEATTTSWRDRALSWTQKCSRYEWLGAIPHPEALELLANSQLTVLTSHHEGAPSVFSEAAALGVPILSTRIPASIGILGGNHPGLFNCGDALDLANLIERAESDPGFYQELGDASAALRDRLSPEAEMQAWETLLASFAPAC